MNFLANVMLFDKKVIMNKGEQKKIYSYLFVICLVLLSSLVVVIGKTMAFDEKMFIESIKQVEQYEPNQVIYADGLNQVKIGKNQFFLNGERLISFDELGSKGNSMMPFGDGTGQLKFIIFIYQYLSSFKYLLLFITLVTLLSWTSRKQIRVAEDISLDYALTYTSYIMMIPILVCMVIRFLNIRFSFTILLLTVLSVILEFLFVQYYIKEKRVSVG